MGTSCKILLLCLLIATLSCSLGQHDIGRTLRDMDPLSQEIHVAAAFAFISHLESLQDSEPGRHFVRVVKAVERNGGGGGAGGGNWTWSLLKMELGYSSCTKGELLGGGGARDCVLDPKKKTFNCLFLVLIPGSSRNGEETNAGMMELVYTKCPLKSGG